MVAQKIEQENELFKSRQFKSVALVTFKTVSMEWLSSLEKKEKLLLDVVPVVVGAIIGKEGYWRL